MAWQAPHDRVCHVLTTQSGPLTDYILESVEVIEKALDKYSLDQLAVSFNGGKDCLVAIEIFCYVLFRKQKSIATCPKIKAAFVSSSEPFSALINFVDQCKVRYNLDIYTLEAPTMLLAFENFLNQNTDVKAIILGTRRSDPFSGSLGFFNVTDNGWPSFERINPLINWDYHLIWKYILTSKAQYCSLYDDGYTSLGGTKDTKKNSYLAIENGKYLPAYKLEDSTKERDGRN